MDNFIYQLSFFVSFILTFFFIVIVFLLVSEFIFKSKFFRDKQEEKIKFYGIFMGMSNYHIFLLSIKSIAYIFMIWALFYDSLEIIHFIFFISLHVLFDLFAKRFLALIPNLFNYTFISFLLFSKLVFYQYLVEVGFVWYVFLLMLLLGIFTFLYGSYFYFSDVFFLLKQNKYVKKVKKKK